MNFGDILIHRDTGATLMVVEYHPELLYIDCRTIGPWNGWYRYHLLFSDVFSGLWNLILVGEP